MAFAGRLARIDLVRSPAKSLFAALGIAIGVAVVVAIFTVDHNTVLSEQLRRNPDYARLDLEVFPGKAAGDRMRTLENLPGVARVGEHRKREAVLRLGERTIGPTLVIGMDAGARDEDLRRADDGGFRALDWEAGSKARLEPGTAYAGPLLAEKAGIQQGAVVTLALPERRAATRTLCIDGIRRPVDAPERPGRAQPSRRIEVRVAGRLLRTRVGRMAGGNLMIVGLDDFERLFPRTRGTSPTYWVEMQSGADLDSMREDLTGAGFVVNEARTGAVGEEPDERAFRNGVRVAGMMALLLGLFVIFHTLAMSLVEKVRQVGILEALGATRAQIGRVFFLEACLLAGLGAVAGAAMGVWLGHYLLDLGVTTLGLDKPVTTRVVPWPKVVGVSGLGWVVALAGAVFPLMRARAVSVIRVISARDLGPATDVYRGLTRFLVFLFVVVVPVMFFVFFPVLGERSQEVIAVTGLGLVLFGLFLVFLIRAPRLVAAACRVLLAPVSRRMRLEGMLATRSIAEGTGRIAASVCGIALVAAAFVTLKGMTLSLEEDAAGWARVGMEDKVFVSMGEGQPKIPYEEIRAFVAERGDADGLEPAMLRRHAPFQLIAVRPEDCAAYGPFADDPALAERFQVDNLLIVSPRLARRRGLRIGSEVILQSDTGPHTFQVAAVSPAYGVFDDNREFAAIDERHMQRLYCGANEAVDRFTVHLSPGGDPDVLAGALTTAFGEGRKIKVVPGPERRAHLVADVRHDFRLFDIILGLVAVLAGVGLLNALLIASLEKEKEVGILRALGVTRGQISRVTLIEGVVVGCMGGVVGAALGLPFTFVVEHALRSLSSLDLPYVVDWRWAGLAVAGSAVLAAVAALYPIARAARRPVVAAIRYE